MHYSSINGQDKRKGSIVLLGVSLSSDCYSSSGVTFLGFSGTFEIVPTEQLQQQNCCSTF